MAKTLADRATHYFGPSRAKEWAVIKTGIRSCILVRPAGEGFTLATYSEEPGRCRGDYISLSETQAKALRSALA